MGRWAAGACWSLWSVLRAECPCRPQESRLAAPYLYLRVEAEEPSSENKESGVVGQPDLASADAAAPPQPVRAMAVWLWLAKRGNMGCGPSSTDSPQSRCRQSRRVGLRIQLDRLDNLVQVVGHLHRAVGEGRAFDAAVA